MAPRTKGCAPIPLPYGDWPNANAASLALQETPGGPRTNGSGPLPLAHGDWPNAHATCEPDLSGNAALYGKPPPEDEEASHTTASRSITISTVFKAFLPRRRFLSKEVSPELLRAVALWDALSGFGRYLQRLEPNGGGWPFLEAGFALSKEVRRIDDFWSHSWSTLCWRKTSALLFLYNSAPAVALTVLLSFLFLGLEIGGRHVSSFFSAHYVLLIAGVEVDVECPVYPLVLCPLLFLMVLFFGQRLRQLLFCCRPQQIFLDRMCIHQTDETRKDEAILSLAGILECSNRLVIMWCPAYLTRLWCVYELATWIHLGRSFRQTALFVPVCLSLSLFMWAMGIWSYSLVNMLLLLPSRCSEAQRVQGSLASKQLPFSCARWRRSIFSALQWWISPTSGANSRTSRCKSRDVTAVKKGMRPMPRGERARATGYSSTGPWRIGSPEPRLARISRVGKRNISRASRSTFNRSWRAQCRSTSTAREAATQ